ncbi:MULTISPECIES: GDSL-type esterase/lipase family protein [Arthrobacter]|uniref:GDSL-type esterase/lipase family protein n=1 Tax=Arthrobacter caoxuetaonis TaxID=2886935 RepID=A0A9X1MBB4_9MICC|nr:GDSL-type esterase/lipase family protein [Arthrobacter caoxuetaonis]MCC3280916.1 GDSL-type esterase/lipase family protein [Arthrobacter caoxuetaonis]MCC3296844.1 GDSL-type esterase/lipase family protein [Arthrobacter caoxuetaonis]MCC9192920.1 GDSL-type esterase/lipase family protein [Arthrobacter sp. zg-Y916]USQ56338.1 GDSL-type esterase/lipase family protein [Arthrobacter caoxuetaonis]
MEQRRIRLAAVGDELLAGHGDPRALGWLGRVLARTTPETAQLEAYSLAAPGEGTEALANRWLMEAGRRFDESCENRLVIGLSDRDLDLELSTARSRLNLANILDGAAQMSIKVLVVGPPPGLDAERNRKLADLSAAFGDVTTRRKHVYVDTLTPLLNHEQWRTDLAANGGTPGQAGYGLIAWLVLHRGWFRWLDLPDMN